MEEKLETPQSGAEALSCSDSFPHRLEHFKREEQKSFSAEMSAATSSGDVDQESGQFGGMWHTYGALFLI